MIKNFYTPLLALFLGLIFIDLCGIIGKYLGDIYSTPQLTAFRNLFAILPFFLLLIAKKEFVSLYTDLNSKILLLCTLRGLFLLSMQVFYFLSVINMDFAVATTLSFSSPLFIIVLSVIFLKEKVGFFRWSAVAIGFIGVVLIMQPTSSIFTFYSFLPIFASISWAATNIILRLLPENLSMLKIHFHTFIWALLGSGLLFFLTGTYVPIETSTHLMLLVLIGFLGGIASLLFIFSYRATSPSILAPFEYFGIPSSIFLGWFFFSEKPFGQLFPGAILIIIAGLIIVWRENRVRP